MALGRKKYGNYRTDITTAENTSGHVGGIVLSGEKGNDFTTTEIIRKVISFLLTFISYCDIICISKCDASRY